MDNSDSSLPKSERDTFKSHQVFFFFFFWMHPPLDQVWWKPHLQNLGGAHAPLRDMILLPFILILFCLVIKWPFLKISLKYSKNKPIPPRFEGWPWVLVTATDLCDEVPTSCRTFLLVIFSHYCDKITDIHCGWQFEGPARYDGEVIAAGVRSSSLYCIHTQKAGRGRLVLSFLLYFSSCPSSWYGVIHTVGNLSVKPFWAHPHRCTKGVFPMKMNRYSISVSLRSTDLSADLFFRCFYSSRGTLNHVSQRSHLFPPKPFAHVPRNLSQNPLIRYKLEENILISFVSNNIPNHSFKICMALWPWSDEKKRVHQFVLHLMKWCKPCEEVSSHSASL